MSFWSADVINNASVKTNQLKVDLDVQSLNRKYDRTEYFDIEAALTVDFMGMFVEFVQGDLIKKLYSWSGACSRVCRFLERRRHK